MLFHILRRITGASGNILNLRFAAKPHPEFSYTWRDAYWSPPNWQTLIDKAFEKYGPSIGFVELESRRNRKIARRITREQFHLLAVYVLDGCVGNGGISSFLTEDYGSCAEEAIAGLRMFGLNKHAEIMDEAFNLFGPRPVPRDDNERWKRLESINKSPDIMEAWDELECDYYRSDSEEPRYGNDYRDGFTGPIAEWIYEHRDRFFVI